MRFSLFGFRASPVVCVKITPDQRCDPEFVTLKLRETIPLRIKVINANGNPLPGAQVNTTERFQPGCASGVADVNGEILTAPVDPEGNAGEELVFSCAGYATKTWRIPTNWPEKPPCIALDPAPPVNGFTGRIPQEILLSEAFPFNQGTEVHFRLFDLETGLPIASCPVYCSNWRSPEERRHAVASPSMTNSNGEFIWNGAAPGLNLFSLSIKGYGRGDGKWLPFYFLQPVFVWPGQNLSEVIVRLRPGKQVRFQILNFDGHPVSGGDYRFSVYPNRNQIRQDFLRQETDRNGMICFEDLAWVGLGLPLGDDNGNLSVQIASISSGETIRLHIPSPDNPPDIVVKGLMFDQDGRLFQNRSLSYFWELAPGEATDKHSISACSSGISTDSSGQFTFLLRKARYRLRFYGSHRTKDWIEFTAGNMASNSLRVELNEVKPLSVVIRVTDQEGKPVVGAGVTFGGCPAWNFFDKYFTDASGSLRLSVDTSEWKSSQKGMVCFWGPGTPSRSTPLLGRFPLEISAKPARGASFCELTFDFALLKPGSLDVKMAETPPGTWLATAIAPTASSTWYLENRRENVEISSSGNFQLSSIPPGDYWLKISNDQRLARNFSSDFGDMITYGKGLPYYHPQAQLAVLPIRIREGQVTNVGPVSLDLMATVLGQFPGWGQPTQATGTEWLAFERRDTYWVMDAQVEFLPCAESESLLPAFRIPVFIGGQLYTQIPAGSYRVRYIPQGDWEPQDLGLLPVTGGKEYRLSPVGPLKKKKQKPKPIPPSN
ncbi:MAG: hypothetical protein WA705_18505 [Candidatus Ozemobacteraceae bacterium]